MQKNRYKADSEPLPLIAPWLCGGVTALITGGVAAWLLVPFANAQRDYPAVGGEWLLVLAAALAAFHVSKWLWVQRCLDKRFYAEEKICDSK